MTTSVVVHEDDQGQQASSPTRARPPRFARRLWDLPLGVHAAVLGLVLACALPFVGTRSILFSDEGATLVQARQLERGDGWITPYAFARIDPHQEAFPFASSDPGHDGSAAYAKHPALPLLVAGADRLAGNTGVLLVSVFGTVLAAMFAGLLAMRWSPISARPTLWFVGLATPLLFDSYLVVGHTLGAALAAVAVWCVLRCRDRASLGSSLGAVAATVACVAFRTEGVFLGIAIATAVLWCGGRSRQWRWCAVGAMVGASGLAVRLLEPKVVRHLLGVPNVSPGPVSFGSDGRVLDAWHGFVRTWLSPTYGGSSPRQTVVVLVAVLVIGGALVVRLRPADGHAVILVSLLGVGAALALNLQVAGLVPGLVFACPLLVAGLLLLRRATLAGFTPRFLLAVWVLFTLAVIATQYGVGGSVEWGGRYFAIGLPLIAPVVVDSFRIAGGTLARKPRRVAAVSAVVVALVLGVAAVRAVRNFHAASTRLTAVTERISEATRPGDGGAPVILTDDQYLPKAVWAVVDRRRIAWPPPADVGPFLRKVRAMGVERLVYATRDPSKNVRRLSPDFRVVQVVSLDVGGAPWRFVVLRAR